MLYGWQEIRQIETFELVGKTARKIMGLNPWPRWGEEEEWRVQAYGA